VNDQRQDEAESVYEDMSLAPFKTVREGSEERRARQREDRAVPAGKVARGFGQAGPRGSAPAAGRVSVGVAFHHHEVGVVQEPVHGGGRHEIVEEEGIPVGHPKMLPLLGREKVQTRSGGDGRLIGPEQSGPGGVHGFAERSIPPSRRGGCCS